MDRKTLEEAISCAQQAAWHSRADWWKKPLIAAAEAHLATLPREPVKVTRWLVVSNRGEWGPFSEQIDAQCVHRKNADSLIVPLTGEYQQLPE